MFIIHFRRSRGTEVVPPPPHTHIKIWCCNFESLKYHPNSTPQIYKSFHTRCMFPSISFSQKMGIPRIIWWIWRLKWPTHSVENSPPAWVLANVLSSASFSWRDCVYIWLLLRKISWFSHQAGWKYSHWYTSGSSSICTQKYSWSRSRSHFSSKLFECN